MESYVRVILRFLSIALFTIGAVALLLGVVGWLDFHTGSHLNLGHRNWPASFEAAAIGFGGLGLVWVFWGAFKFIVKVGPAAAAPPPPEAR
jgi:hypothetical protein